MQPRVGTRTTLIVGIVIAVVGVIACSAFAFFVYTRHQNRNAHVLPTRQPPLPQEQQMCVEPVNQYPILSTVPSASASPANNECYDGITQQQTHAQAQYVMKTQPPSQFYQVPQRVPYSLNTIMPKRKKAKATIQKKRTTYQKKRTKARKQKVRVHKKCPKCIGVGWIHKNHLKHIGPTGRKCMFCEDCKCCCGTGLFKRTGTSCSKCHGNGWVHASLMKHKENFNRKCFFCENCKSCGGRGRSANY